MISVKENTFVKFIFFFRSALCQVERENILDNVGSARYGANVYAISVLDAACDHVENEKKEEKEENMEKKRTSIRKAAIVSTDFASCNAALDVG
jgi:hypothetical protein